VWKLVEKTQDRFVLADKRGNYMPGRQKSPHLFDLVAQHPQMKRAEIVQIFDAQALLHKLLLGNSQIAGIDRGKKIPGLLFDDRGILARIETF
jgi:hypothetical protein